VVLSDSALHPQSDSGLRWFVVSSANNGVWQIMPLGTFSNYGVLKMSTDKVLTLVNNIMDTLENVSEKQKEHSDEIMQLKQKGGLHPELITGNAEPRSGFNYLVEKSDRPNLGHYVQRAAGYDVKATIAEGSISAGGAVVPIQQIPEIIDILRNSAQVLNAGARVLPLTSKSATIPKLLTEPTAAWRSESGAVAASDATFSQITLTPRSLSVEIKVSREWMMDQDRGAALIQFAIMQSMGIQLDAAALFGTGVAPQPLGLKAQLATASRVLSMGANGAKLSAQGYYKNLVVAAQRIAQANDVATGAIMSARSMYDIGGFVDSSGQPLQAPKILTDRVPFYESNSVSDALTQGTATNASDIYIGNWSKLIWGLREDVSIQILSEKYASTGEIGVVAHLRADLAVENINSFYLISGVLPE
jgi:HK97 family phage major capsid protein